MSLEFATKVAREINSIIIMHPRFKTAFDGILEIVRTASIVDLPFGASVVAPSGCGKTALMKSIMRAIPSSQFLQDDVRSVCVAAEANSTVGHLAMKLLQQLGYPASIRASKLSEQGDLISTALREHGIKVLFIDESQHICRGKRMLSALGTTDWIKQLVDGGEVVVIMLGTRELRPLSDINDQLGSRAPAHFELKEFERNEDWIGLLKQIADSVSIFDLSSIHKIFYKQLHSVTNGALRPLKQILIAAVFKAIAADKKALDKASFVDAHRLVFGSDPHIPNAFLYD